VIPVRRHPRVIRILLLLASLASVSLCAGCRRANEPVRDDATPDGKTSEPWLSVEQWSDLPVGGWELDIFSDGTARARLWLERNNGYVGTFQTHLTEERIDEVREAVRGADLYSMRDEYPPRRKAVDAVWVQITERTGRGEKTVRAARESRVYPRPLRTLIDLSESLPTEKMSYAPAGLLSEVASEVSEYPVHAVGARLLVGGTFRAGEPLHVTLILTNVGTEPITLPSLQCKWIAYGRANVRLMHDPITLDEIAGRYPGQWYREYGPIKTGYVGPADEHVLDDLPGLVHLAPGEEWRITVPKRFIPPSPGRYQVQGEFDATLAYDRSALPDDLADTFLECRVWAKPQFFMIRD
jgi:hypothetical protein